MLPFIKIGPLVVQLPGLALLAGVWIGMGFVEKEAVRLRLNAAAVLNMITYGLVGGLIGARLLYGLEHLNAYLAAPLSLLAINARALDLWGGLLVGGAVALLYGRRRGLALRPTMDAVAPGLAIYMIAAGIAAALGGNGYGSAADVPWAIQLWGQYRHPTQVYETILALAIFLVWKFLPPSEAAPGARFWQVFGLSAGARIFTEAFHGDSLTVVGGFRVAQLVALPLLAAAMYMSRRWSALADNTVSLEKPSGRHRSLRRRPPTAPSSRRNSRPGAVSKKSQK